MTERKLISILFLLASLVCDAQTQHKVIVNFNAHRSDFSRPGPRIFKHSFWFPSLEYLRKKDNRILSFELAKYTVRTMGDKDPDASPYLFQTYRDKNRQALFRFQYQRLTKVLVQDQLVSVYPYYGMALTPHYVYTNRVAVVPGFTDMEVQSLGLTSHASLGLYCQFKRFFININTLWGIGQVQFVERNEQIETTSVLRKQTTFTEVKLLPKDNLFRIGIGLEL